MRYASSEKILSEEEAPYRSSDFPLFLGLWQALPISLNELARVLFSNVALMELVGFNARQVQEGLTRRGDGQRKTKKKQGPLSPQCLADNISKLSREQMETLFNQMVQCVVGS